MVNRLKDMGETASWRLMVSAAVEGAKAQGYELKRQPGQGIYLCGGGDLAGALLPEIDRLILKRNPVVLGSGIRLFGTTGATIQRFRLVGSRAFESGVVIEEYARAIQ